MTDAEYARKHYAVMHKMFVETPGVCNTCGRPYKGKYKTCAKCRAQGRKNMAKIKREGIEYGLCTVCLKAFRGDTKMCPECIEKAHGTMNRRKALGLCINCGKPLEGNTCRCTACNERQRERQRQWRAKQKSLKSQALGRESSTDAEPR